MAVLLVGTFVNVLVGVLVGLVVAGMLSVVKSATASVVPVVWELTTSPSAGFVTSSGVGAAPENARPGKSAESRMNINTHDSLRPIATHFLTLGGNLGHQMLQSGNDRLDRSDIGNVQRACPRRTNVRLSSRSFYQFHKLSLLCDATSATISSSELISAVMLLSSKLLPLAVKAARLVGVSGQLFLSANDSDTATAAVTNSTIARIAI